MIAPDFAEPIVAWRTWRVVREAEGVRLRSVVQPTVWEPRQELVCECLRAHRAWLPWRRPRDHHDAPHAQCTCGIYASTRADVVGRYTFATQFDGRDVLVRVVGLVALWGRVVACTHGWRGEFAYPRRILIPQRERDDEDRLEELGLALADYGVPIEIVRHRDTRDFVRSLA